MNRMLEATEHYQQALKTGRKTHRQKVQQGQYPYLQVLDDILTGGMTAGEYKLGLIEIPTESIVGTKSAGRTNAFASDFMPLLPTDSEFGTKWSKLCAAHLSDEGIREPIICYEYLGRFYVQEGNKRVSVLKYFDAGTILGEVTRILPGESDDPEVLAYRDFLTYYPLTKLYPVHFTRIGSFQKLQFALGHEPEHAWSDEERRDFMSGYYTFEAIYRKMGGDDLYATTADALLEWLKIYSFDQLQSEQTAELTRTLETIWPDIKAIGQPDAIELDMECEACEDKGLLNLLSFSRYPAHLSIAFIHELSPETSAWVYSHEVGRMHLEEVMGDSVTVQCFKNVGCGEEAEQAMETAIANGAEVLFTTTPPLIAACRKVAARHPEVKIFNCSIEMPFADVRTYYGRIYEGMFISGAIAGAISKTDDIGYIANYPIFGVPAGINAFALGAQLTNPYARIQLRWSCVDDDPLKDFKDRGVEVISTQEIYVPGCIEGQGGTFRLLEDGASERIAAPYWDWGTFYVQFTRSILGGDWDAPLFGKPERRAVNYWWGMSCGVIDIKWADTIPSGTKVLAGMLKDGIISGSIDPFRCQILSQDGTLRNDGSRTLSPEEILKMDWLCSNVAGTIPGFDRLNEKSRPLVRLQGIYRDSTPLQKESVLL